MKQRATTICNGWLNVTCNVEQKKTVTGDHMVQGSIHSAKSRQNYPLLLKVSMEVTPGVVVPGRGIPECCLCSGFDLRAGSAPPLPTPGSVVCVKICGTAHF